MIAKLHLIPMETAYLLSASCGSQSARVLCAWSTHSRLLVNVAALGAGLLCLELRGCPALAQIHPPF